MFALCVESSHRMGMGHLFRMLTFARYLGSKGAECVFIINDDECSVQVLKEAGYEYHVADYDACGEWEGRFIRDHNVHCWLNDRLATSDSHGRAIRGAQVGLVTFDDDGDGANYADLQIMALPMSDNLKPRARRVVRGVDCLILNDEIVRYRRLRTRVEKICICMGGSDTHGVTVKVVQLLKDYGVPASVILGPGFMHEKELNMVIDSRYPVVRSPSSLMRSFSEYDIAITGGGITPFEAVASGLPCVVIANEHHEIPNGEYLKDMGAAYYFGHYEAINGLDIVNALKDNNKVRSLSERGMQLISLDGCKDIFSAIKEVGQCV